MVSLNLLSLAVTPPPKNACPGHIGPKVSQPRLLDLRRKRIYGGQVVGHEVELVAAATLVDPWAPGAAVDSQSLASQLFALSLFPYLGFLYHLTKSKTAPGLTLFGFYFLLAFVGATIPAGIYAKVHYGTSLSNVDWLHGGAESFLTLTNLFIVLGLRKALRESAKEKDQCDEITSSS